MVNIFSIESLYQFLAQSFISFISLNRKSVKTAFLRFFSGSECINISFLVVKGVNYVYFRVKTFLNCPHHRKFLKNRSILRIRCRSGSGGAGKLKKNLNRCSKCSKESIFQFSAKSTNFYYPYGKIR